MPETSKTRPMPRPRAAAQDEADDELDDLDDLDIPVALLDDETCRGGAARCAPSD